jgi:HNH endonuclease
MRCLFCKEPSDNSRSVEHVLPESLGNTTATLPPGVVCDTCNNYFARKVEAPFLNSEDISSFRFHQAIPNKRGRIPSLEGVLDSAIPITAYRYREGPIQTLLDVPLEGIERIFRNKQGHIDFPPPSKAIDDRVMSRFLAKSGLEMMAFRLQDKPDGLEYLVDEEALDPIRVYARYNKGGYWPYSIRRIYDQDRKWTTLTGDVQRVWEADFLVIDPGQWYFIVAIFGLELGINTSYRAIEGYTAWLRTHNHASPLYVNAEELTKGLNSIPSTDSQRKRR